MDEGSKGDRDVFEDDPKPRAITRSGGELLPLREGASRRTTVTEFQLIGYLQLLTEGDVAFLIVGGVSARLQGAATTTHFTKPAVDCESSPTHMSSITEGLT